MAGSKMAVRRLPMASLVRATRSSTARMQGAAVGPWAGRLQLQAGPARVGAPPLARMMCDGSMSDQERAQAMLAAARAKRQAKAEAAGMSMSELAAKEAADKEAAAAGGGAAEAAQPAAEPAAESAAAATGSSEPAAAKTATESTAPADTALAVLPDPRGWGVAGVAG